MKTKTVLLLAAILSTPLLPMPAHAEPPAAKVAAYIGMLISRPADAALNLSPDTLSAMSGAPLPNPPPPGGGGGGCQTFSPHSRKTNGPSFGMHAEAISCD